MQLTLSSKRSRSARSRVMIVMAAIFMVLLGGFVLMVMQPPMLSSDGIYDGVELKHFDDWGEDDETPPNCPDEDVFRKLLDKQHSDFVDYINEPRRAREIDRAQNYSTFIASREFNINGGLQEIMSHNALDLINQKRIDVNGNMVSPKTHASVSMYEELYELCYGRKY